MQEETILYDPAARAFCILNSTAAHLWEQLAQPRSEPELAAALQTIFAVDAGYNVQQDVRSSLERLKGLDLIEQASDQ